MENQKKPILYIITNNHFDLTWRRCWERPFIDQGRTFVSYADLQEYYMLDNLALCRQNPNYKFEAESTYVLRKFLERHPETLNELQALAKAGRFAVTGGGEAIIDANMVHGESLVRNYVDGLLWVDAILGQKTHLAVRNDAFGNSAQLPQILRGCEIAWATGMSYSPAQGRYWRGLDGSTIMHQTLPVAAAGGGNTKYPPCPVCGGDGLLTDRQCPTCHGRGIDPQLRSWLPDSIRQAALQPFGAALVLLTPEELLPNPDILQWANVISDAYDVRFAVEEEALDHIWPWLEAVDHPAEDQLHPSTELNPNNSGCLVTRIKTKQNVRRQEYAILAAETLGVMAALKSAALQGDSYPAEALKSIRHKQFFTMFHDAITATHVDAAYEELLDYYRAIDQEISLVQNECLTSLVQPAGGTISVINPSTQPLSAVCTAVILYDSATPAIQGDDGKQVTLLATREQHDGRVAVDFLALDIPALGAKTFQVVPGSSDPNELTPLAQPVIENTFFRVSADRHGLLAIFDKQLNREIAAQGQYRPGELILEHDAGSPWATLSQHQDRLPLAQHTRLITTEQGSGFQRLVFAVEVPREGGFSGKALRAQVTVSLIEGLARVEFQVKAYWDGFNHRLRVAMPVPFSGKHLYEIPYGMIERQPYDPWFRWAGANGDWPAINWAGVEGSEASVALFNRGIPSYRIEPDMIADAAGGEVIFLSLLRSPTLPTYLHEPEFYTMTAYDGMRDMGDHEFDFAVTAYLGPFANSMVVPDAESYNLKPLVVSGKADLPALPQVESFVARLAALKWAGQGQALILRLVEFRGQGGQATLRLPFTAHPVEKVNLLERHPESLALKNGTLTLNLRPWEIATLKISLP